MDDSRSKPTLFTGKVLLYLVSDASGKLLAFPDSLKTHALVCENQQLKKELNALNEETENVQHALKALTGNDELI